MAERPLGSFVSLKFLASGGVFFTQEAMSERPLGSFDSLKFVASGGFDVYF